MTPFVPPRYLKPRGPNSLEGQIAAELASRDFPTLIDVQRLEPWADARTMVSVRAPGETAVGVDPETRNSDWLLFRHFIRSRRRGPPPPVDCGFPLRLRLSQPIPGPLCLGYGSHFGLGLFRPAMDSAADESGGLPPDSGGQTQ